MLLVSSQMLSQFPVSVSGAASQQEIAKAWSFDLIICIELNYLREYPKMLPAANVFQSKTSTPNLP